MKVFSYLVVLNLVLFSCSSGKSDFEQRKQDKSITSVFDTNVVKDIQWNFLNEFVEYGQVVDSLIVPKQSDSLWLVPICVFYKFSSAYELSDSSQKTRVSYGELGKTFMLNDSFLRSIEGPIVIKVNSKVIYNDPKIYKEIYGVVKDSTSLKNEVRNITIISSLKFIDRNTNQSSLSNLLNSEDELAGYTFIMQLRKEAEVKYIEELITKLKQSKNIIEIDDSDLFSNNNEYDLIYLIKK